MTENTTAARIRSLILGDDGLPTTGSLIPISIRPQDGVLSGDTDTSLVAAAPTPPPPPPGQPQARIVSDTGTATLWYFVRSNGGNDPIEVREVDPALYTALVSFPDPANPTGLVLLTLQGNAILDSAGSTFGPTTTLDYLFLIVFVNMDTDGEDPDMEGYGIVPLQRAVITP